MTLPRIAILGGGPAGVGAAYQLRRLNRADVTLIEAQGVVGGNAGSFEWRGQRLDFGSHRLHPACEPAILADIRALLGDDLLDRPRHGRIRLRGRWIHFPLKPLDILRRVDPGFAAGIVRDGVAKAIRSRVASGTSFEDVLSATLGPTICGDFYFPYARKIWGFEPRELSGTQARRRVSANSFAKLAKKVLSQVPGLRPPGGGRFFYPRNGFGQITESYASAAQQLGATFRYGARVTGLEPPARDGAAWVIHAEGDGGREEIAADHVWSTLPITVMARSIRADAPANVAQAASDMRYRAMILIYVALDIDRFTEYDAHYFPDARVRITRLSEPKNYSARGDPRGRTVLCAELPCSVTDSVWEMSDRTLADLVARDLATAGIPLPGAIADVLVRRLRQAYPIYLEGYERAFETLTTWVNAFPRLLTFGRQGLFAHDNTHHALAMAYGAADCIVGGRFDQGRWDGYLERFATHVVED